MQLSFEPDAVVVVAGVPGAGKTTLIRRAVDRRSVRVVDTDDEREAGRRRLLYVRHWARIAIALVRRRPLVVHTRGTSAVGRRAIAALARVAGRPAHLLLLDAGRAEAEVGQRRRGRTLPPRAMSRQVARWRRLRTRGEGWASVVRLDRGAAARVEAIGFGPGVVSGHRVRRLSNGYCDSGTAGRRQRSEEALHRRRVA
jgi:AAA domain-containing protein